MKSHRFSAAQIVLLFAAALTVVVTMELTNSRGQQDPRIDQMILSIHAGDKATILAALEADPAFIRQKAGEETWLHVAARADRPEVIELLLAKGADLNARGLFDGTALHWACLFGAEKAAERLLEKGLDIEDKSDVFGSTPLLWAAQGSSRVANPNGDYIATVRMLIDKGASPDTYNDRGVPAVSLASEEVAEELEKHGARVPMPVPAGGHLAM